MEQEQNPSSWRKRKGSLKGLRQNEENRMTDYLESSEEDNSTHQYSYHEAQTILERSIPLSTCSSLHWEDNEKALNSRS